MRDGGALSKANQAVTSNSMPNADPINIDLLRAKHPEPAHPDGDPVRLSSILWPEPQSLDELLLLFPSSPTVSSLLGLSRIKLNLSRMGTGKFIYDGSGAFGDRPPHHP